MAYGQDRTEDELPDQRNTYRGAGCIHTIFNILCAVTQWPAYNAEIILDQEDLPGGK